MLSLKKKKNDASNGKKNKRAKTQFAALKPELNLKIRYNEIADFDYLHKLNDEEKKWLNDFVEGTVNASRKSELFKDKPEEWKKNENRNNSRNRCIMSRAQANNAMVYFNELIKNREVKTDDWDKVITKIDKKKK